MAGAPAIALAARLLRDGDAAAAAPLLRAALQDDPQDADALHLLGIVESQRGRFDVALPLLQQAAALRPGDAAVHNNLGNTLAGCDRDGEAVDAFDRAIALDPKHAKAWRNRGAALRRRGRLMDALDSFERALGIEPDFVDALVGKADALEAMHRKREAIATLHAAIAAGGDAAALGYTLATLGAAPLPEATPPGFVRTLFDHYADHFDAHLVDGLQYRAPALIDAAIDAAMPAAAGLDVVDLGCGTGLCGPMLRPRARRLVGVDLSGAMLAKAHGRGVYDELVDAEIVTWLADRPGTFDLAVAADVLIYLGDLEPLFAALSGAIRPAGRLAFTVEDWPGEGFGLKPSGRYGHTAPYLRAIASHHRFEVLALDRHVLRQESDQAIEGHVVVLRRPTPV